MSSSSTKLAFQYALSQLPIQLPSTLQIPKIPSQLSAKQSLVHLLNCLPLDIQSQVCSSLAQCKKCGFHGPYSVVSEHRVCLCGNNLEIIIPPMIEGTVYQNSNSVYTKNLTSLVTFKEQKYYCIRLFKDKVLLNDGDQENLLRESDFELYIEKQQGPIFDQIGRVVLAIYVNHVGNSERTIEFSKIQPKPRIYMNNNESAINSSINYTIPQKEVLQKTIYDVQRKFPKDFQINPLSKKLCCFNYDSAPSHHYKYCEFCGCGCSLTSHFSLLSIMCFIPILLIIITNVVLLLVLIFLRLPDPEVFITDNLIVRNNAAIAMNLNNATYSTFIATQKSLDQIYEIYTQNIITELLQTDLLQNQSPLVIKGVSSDLVTVNQLTVDNVTVTNQTQFDGNSVSTQSITFQPNTNVIFGQTPNFNGLISLVDAKIVDLTASSLNFTQFTQSGIFSSPLKVNSLTTKIGKITELTTKSLTSQQLTVDTLKVTGNSILSQIKTTNLTVQQSLSVSNSIVNLPQLLKFNSTGRISGDLNIEGILQTGQNTIQNLQIIDFKGTTSTIQSLNTQIINAAESRLDIQNLISQSALITGQAGGLSINGNKIIESNINGLSLGANSINCTTFTVAKNLDVGVVNTTRIN
ncbi:hypothetical protein SS50377_23069 [Spironucleus salmonicida]|uniref:Uncharacterized protein n=1 Tax=Spironucleus salmonicida TaxID=348837 RepID=V6M307_9EUKA|nr:hypothetical protein SS50377_23069 [Spironucleus salmonicida]|eukprot:EST47649.1 Hypothetical protein SS50377_12344 [Spironucleus salmonicida]